MATLSADATFALSADDVGVSLYKPENGWALNALAGIHIGEYVTLQANYIWNRNAISASTVGAGLDETSVRVFDQRFRTTQHAVVGDLLVYFRDRSSRLRPYLSSGIGVVRFRAEPDGSAVHHGSVATIGRISATEFVLRVAVGIDVAAGHRWRVRYSFSEGISHNPISSTLTPPGRRGLANFQNLVGLVCAF